MPPSNKSQTFLLIILPIVGFILGAGLMYVLDNNLTQLPGVKTTPSSSAEPITKILEGEITDPAKQFGILTQKSYITMQLKGTVTRIEPGITKAEGGKGSNVTLKSGSDFATIFLIDKATGYTGDYGKSDTWKKISELPSQALKVGDDVVIETNATFSGKPITSESFYGWWYLKL